MSRTVDLFIDSDQPLAQLAAFLGDLIGRQFVATPDGARYVLRDGSVTAYLTEHDFLDEDELPLSEFRYVLSVVVRATGEIEESEETACLRRINTQLRAVDSCPSLLVIDLERPDDAPLGQK